MPRGSCRIRKTFCFGQDGCIYWGYKDLDVRNYRPGILYAVIISKNGSKVKTEDVVDIQFKRWCVKADFCTLEEKKEPIVRLNEGDSYWVIVEDKETLLCAVRKRTEGANNRLDILFSEVQNYFYTEEEAITVMNKWNLKRSKKCKQN
jgi:hypothetical protein